MTEGFPDNGADEVTTKQNENVDLELRRSEKDTVITISASGDPNKDPPEDHRIKMVLHRCEC